MLKTIVKCPIMQMKILLILLLLESKKFHPFDFQCQIKNSKLMVFTYY